MNMKPRVRDGKTGQYVKTGRGVNIGVRVPSELMSAIQHYAEGYFWDEKKQKGNINQAATYLIYRGLLASGFEVDSDKIPVPSDTRGDHSAAPTTATATLDHSPVNVTTSGSSSATVQVGNSNRNVSVKKNHDKPVRSSKRRK